MRTFKLRYLSKYHGRQSCEFKSREIFTIKNSFTCASSNLIYVIRCNGCKKDYIGQTGNTLRKRFTVHRQQIRHKEIRMINVNEHLDLCVSNKSPKYYVFPFYQCDDQFTEEMRINKENMFIQKYKPSLNR